MNKFRTILFSILLIELFACSKTNKEKKDSDSIDYEISLEKIVIINLDEACITYFKTKIKNSSSKDIILQDNDVDSVYSKTEGFYLEGVKNKVIPIGINKFNYQKIPAKSDKYYFLAIKNFKYSFEKSDSLKFENEISNFKIHYNGEELDFKKFKKSKHVRDHVYANFIKDTSNYYLLKKKFLIDTELNKLPVKYIDYMPIKDEEWQSL